MTDKQLEAEIEYCILSGDADDFIVGWLGCDYPIVRKVRARLDEQEAEVETQFGSLVPHGGGGPGVDWRNNGSDTD